MRTFIAIPLPRETKDLLGSLQNHLKTSGADVKWVAPRNIHLTLKFLGEIDEGSVPAIIASIEAIALRHRPFQAHLGALGAFPTVASARVIWTAIDEGNRQLSAIAKDLEEDLAKLGFPKEDRPFSSHITLGRIKSTAQREKLVQALSDRSIRFDAAGCEFKVEAITLFKSTLTPQGPNYTILKEATLSPI